MTDPHGDRSGDPHGDLSDDLRRVLGKGSTTRSGPDAEALLSRVRTGARRRRARRAAGVALAGAAAAATVVAVAVPSADQSNQLPAASSPPPSETVGSSPLAAPRQVEPGAAVEPTDVRVRAVTAAGRDEAWVLGEGTCDGGECSVVGHAAAGVQAPLDFRAAPGTPGGEVTMRMADNGDDGWVVNDGELFATHDSADSWTAVKPPMAEVSDVVTSAPSVWVTGSDRRGRTVVASAAVEEDTFIDAELPDELAGSGVVSEPVLTGDEQERRFGFLRAGESAVEFVAYEEQTGQWQTYPIQDCDNALSLSGTSQALWAMCERGGTFSPMVSADGGETWDLVEVDIGLGADPRIAAIDEDTAFLSTGIALYQLNGDDLLSADPGPEGAGSKTYEYLGFEDQAGFMIDTDGVLSYSTNAGASWEPVELP